MSWIAGIDYSTHAVDFVLIDENGDLAPVWKRFPLKGQDAFDRARHCELRGLWGFLEDTMAVGIEAAIQAWTTRGFGPWPNTRRMCGL
jgi:hypothetical protein